MIREYIRTALLGLAAAELLLHASACSRIFQSGAAGPATAGIVSPAAVAISDPVPIEQVEDAAFWVNPTDPVKSLLIISNKTHGLELHRPDGFLLKHYEDGSELAGVDVIYDFAYKGQRCDLVIAACPGTLPDQQKPGVRLWRIEPEKQRIVEITETPLHVFDGQTAPLGICGYHSLSTGRQFFFVSSEEGTIEQYEISATAAGGIASKLIRTLKRPGKIKGCVTDEESGMLFAAEEKVGVWRFYAEPTGGSEPSLVMRCGDHGLVSDLTGIALYGASRGRGYLIVVSQGPKGTSSAFGVFERLPPYRYRTTIKPAAGVVGAPRGSSGIAVSNSPAGPSFPDGLLALKSRFNSDGIEDYKIYSWRDIAGAAGLTVDHDWSPRLHWPQIPTSNP